MSHSTIDTKTLGSALNRYGPTSARVATKAGQRPETKTVDIHAHVAIPEAAAYAAPHVDLADIPIARHSNAATREVNQAQDADRKVAIADFDDRIAVLDAMRIDMQVVAPPPMQCYYSIPLEHAVRASQMVNDGLAAFVARKPDRFAALGTVPLQDAKEAVIELERCMNTLGMKGVQVLTNVNGQELSNPAYEPFWRKAEELGALVMLHPNGFTEGRRFHEHYFSNVIGNPLETTIALHYLIFDGVLERMPNLKILAVHGGGYLPAYSGRIDHAWGARRDCKAGLPNPPTHYLRKIYIDNVVFTPHQLEYLARVQGVDKIVMGTDYPFDMADYDPVEHVMGVSSFSDEEVSKIAGLNALKLLGIEG